MPGKKQKRSTAATTEDLPPSKRSKTESSSQAEPTGALARTREFKAQAKGHTLVAGVDEAGRGPLAGPVVAAACILPKEFDCAGINDSKKLSEKQREDQFSRLTTDPNVKYAISIVEVGVIDQINILQATLRAMAEAVEKLNAKVAVDYGLVDGNKLPQWTHSKTFESEAVVGGDGKECVIAAASILAKVTRDRIMVEHHEKWPEYGFRKHKGYGVPEHRAAILKHGPCPIHRMSFAPMKNMKKK